MTDHVLPDWPAPFNIRALFTTRLGGVSKAPYESLNIGAHVGDDPGAVAINRARLDLISAPIWLDQTHSSRCIEIAGAHDDCRADASFTRETGVVLAVMVADCVPILLTNQNGTLAAVIHAGWRGLANGVISNTVNCLQDNTLVAWIGPSIGPCHYEVGNEVKKHFGPAGFTADGDKWRMDLRAISRLQLSQAGVGLIHGGELCTYCDTRRFYSYRRDGNTGRMAGLIWME